MRDLDEAWGRDRMTVITRFTKFPETCSTIESFSTVHNAFNFALSLNWSNSSKSS